MRYRYQTPNNTTKPRRTTCVIFIVLIIGFLFWFFRFSSFFQIKQVLIDDSIYKKELLEIINSNIQDNTNLFAYPSSEIEKQIKEKIRNIAEVKIYKSPPNALKVVIIQRKPMSVLIRGEKKYIVDNYGVTFREYNKKDSSLPQIIDDRSETISIGDKVLTTSFLTFIVDLSKNVTSALSTKITKIEIKENIFEVRVYVEKGFNMIFDTSYSSTEQIADAKKALEIIGNKPIEYLDLRIPGKVYYK